MQRGSLALASLKSASRAYVHTSPAAWVKSLKSSRNAHSRPRAVVRSMSSVATTAVELTRTGTCYCKHTKVTVTGKPVSVSICHCSICRKLSGAPFTMQAVCKAKHVVIEHEGAPSETSSSREVTRYRCAKCGSPIYASLMKGTMIAVPLTILNTPGASDTNLKPTHHMYYPNRIFDVNDELPKYVKSKGDLWTPELDVNVDVEEGGE